MSTYAYDTGLPYAVDTVEGGHGEQARCYCPLGCQCQRPLDARHSQQPLEILTSGDDIHLAGDIASITQFLETSHGRNYNANADPWNGLVAAAGGVLSMSLDRESLLQRPTYDNHNFKSNPCHDIGADLGRNLTTYNHVDARQAHPGIGGLSRSLPADKMNTAAQSLLTPPATRHASTSSRNAGSRATSITSRSTLPACKICREQGKERIPKNEVDAR